MKKNIKIVLNVLISKILYATKLVVNLIPIMIVIITPYLSMWLVITSYNQRGTFSFGGEWLVPLLLYIIAYIVKTAAKALDEDLNGFPVARKRFTKRSTSGNVVFKTSDIYEMADYLAEVEDYCESYGKYGGKR